MEVTVQAGGARGSFRAERPVRSRRSPGTLLRLLGVLLALAVCGPSRAASEDYSAAIRLAVDRWLAVQEASGFFPYGFDFLQDKASEPHAMSIENLARQAGTGAVLADYYARTGDARAEPAIRKMLEALRRDSLPIGKSRTQRLIEETRLLSIPLGRYKLRKALERLGLLFERRGPGMVLSPNGRYSGAYAGTGALAVLAELRFERTSKDTRYAALRQGWLQGLMDLRIPGRGFRAFPTSIDPMPYADGEAWLALASDYASFPGDGRVARMLDTVDDSLMAIYDDRFSVEFYAWGAMAAAARYADSKEAKFLDFIKRQTRTFLHRRRPADDDNECASVEGVADALGALVSAGEGGGELAVRARAWIAREMGKARQLQIQPGQKSLVFANARVVAPRLQEFSGSFLAGEDKLATRVDYTAHCVSAMMKLQRNRGPAGGN